MSDVIADKIFFSEEELKILQFWKSTNVFENIKNARKNDNETEGCKHFTLYDGPPFATGLPHYGHILTTTIKDVLVRYATQNNRFVQRRVGWDCHGLPVEHEVDKMLGMLDKSVRDFDIKSYNDKCRQTVLQYTDGWEEVLERTGCWLDFADDYKTMYLWYIESVWWVFSQLHAKGLVYKGTKVMPYSTGCQTSLSNFEAGQNYREVTEETLTVAFQVVGSRDRLLIWTTTPWSLPANLAVCVHPNMDYVRIKDNTNDSYFILAKGRLQHVFPEYKNTAKYELLDEFKGEKLQNLNYEAPFNYYKNKFQHSRAFSVLLDDYVTQDFGTGIVHLSPFFGEDDYRICAAHNILDKTYAMVCPLDDNGKFTEQMPDLKGVFYKDANKVVTAKLLQANLIINTSPVKHSLPFCWRSDTPLIYKSVSSWFLRVEHMTDELLKNNALTNWVPTAVKEKRFTNWLKNSRDWAISRNRVWGTPIPIWTSESGDELICIGSLAELRDKTGVLNINDLHRETIDQLEIPSSQPGKPPLRRIPEVFDCWFESGAMPYAQEHYPFRNDKRFTDLFPADCIAEGIDQTRGWFYTLLVLSTALHNQPPYRNVIVAGHVLAADGQKMSKRKKNYTSPQDIIKNYGADALRLYLINSPLVRGGCLNFNETGVKSVLKSTLLPWYHVLRFLLQHIEIYEANTNKSFIFEEEDMVVLPEHDLLNRWLLSRNERFVRSAKQQMAKYQLQTVTTEFIEYVEELTNWYVRLKRCKLKDEKNTEGGKRTLSVIFYVLLTMSRTMAPFVPFFTEFVYQRLTKYIARRDLNIDSVHNCLLSPAKEILMDEQAERQFQRFRTAVMLARRLRQSKMIPLKCAVSELVVLSMNEDCLKDLRAWEQELMQELNCKRMTFSQKCSLFGVRCTFKPNYKVLGARLQRDIQPILKAIAALGENDIEAALMSREIQIMSHKCTIPDDVYVSYEIDTNSAKKRYEFARNQDMVIAMDYTTTADMREEALVREVGNHIQTLKKLAKLRTDNVRVFYDLLLQDEKSELLSKVLLKSECVIKNNIKSDFHRSDTTELQDMIAERVVKVQNCLIRFAICKN